MSKKNGHKHKKDIEDKGDKKSKQQDSPMVASGSAYADGAPLDRVQYLEAKLILKPDRFTSVQSLPRLRQDRAAYSEEGLVLVS